MSVDNAIRAIAYSEAGTLGAALALVAKRRNDLDAALRIAAAEPAPNPTRGAATERAIATLEAHLLDRRA